MRYILGLLFMMSSLSVFAQNLKEDFSCLAKTKSGEVFEVKIVNMDFAKEVSLVWGKKICQLPVSYADFRERAKAPLMMIDFSSRTSCSLSKEMKLLSEGFLKVHLDRSEAYIHVLYDHQPIRCDIKTFNQKKLRDRIRASF